MDPKRVKHDALDAMWSFLQMGGQKADKATIDSFKEYCAQLVKALTQKTAGQRANKPKDIDFRELDAIENMIILHSLALYLSGSLDLLRGILPEDG